MSIVENLTNYFTQKESKNLTSPKDVCPNCWGKQEWDGQFYTKIKANNITPEHNTYTNFVHEVAKKLDKITLKGDLLVCETCSSDE